jgi:hypothetical protein
MKVTELRAELEALGLDKTGKKAALEARLEAWGGGAAALRCRAAARAWRDARVALHAARQVRPASAIVCAEERQAAALAEDVVDGEGDSGAAAEQIAALQAQLAEHAQHIVALQAELAPFRAQEAAKKKAADESKAADEARWEVDHTMRPQREGESDEAFAKRCGLKFPLQFHTKAWQDSCQSHCGGFNFKRGDPDENECCHRMPWGLYPCCKGTGFGANEDSEYCYLKTYLGAEETYDDKVRSDWYKETAGDDY